MPQVDLDQDVLDFIRSQVRDFGETPSSVLRRLLVISGQANIPAQISRNGPVPPEIRTVPATAPDPPNRPKEMRARHEGTAIQRYMSILSDLYLADPQRFERVESVKGRKRIYFHKSSLVIDGSGNSVNPERIPGTPYYAATNLSDDKKMRILTDVLRVLGIHGEKKSDYLSALDSGYAGYFPETQSADLDDLI